MRLLSCHLAADNHQKLLAAATGKSKRQVEELIVRYFPRPNVPSSVRRLPAVKPLPAPITAPASAPATAAVLTDKAEVTRAILTPLVTLVPETVPALPPPPARRPLVKPLAPDRYEIRFTANAQTREGQSRYGSRPPGHRGQGPAHGRAP